MYPCLYVGGCYSVALLAEGVDRNEVSCSCPDGVPASPSSRRAWIEIPKSACMPLWCLVALLAEGVDRNIKPSQVGGTEVMSPSSRRAWIEI